MPAESRVCQIKSEVDKNFNYKYKIPPNFIKIDEFVLDNIKEEYEEMMDVMRDAPVKPYDMKKERLH